MDILSNVHVVGDIYISSTLPKPSIPTISIKRVGSTDFILLNDKFVTTIGESTDIMQLNELAFRFLDVEETVEQLSTTTPGVNENAIDKTKNNLVGTEFGINYYDNQCSYTINKDGVDLQGYSANIKLGKDLNNFFNISNADVNGDEKLTIAEGRGLSLTPLLHLSSAEFKVISKKNIIVGESFSIQQPDSAIDTITFEETTITTGDGLKISTTEAKLGGSTLSLQGGIELNTRNSISLHLTEKDANLNILPTGLMFRNETYSYGFEISADGLTFGNALGVYRPDSNSIILGTNNDGIKYYDSGNVTFSVRKDNVDLFTISKGSYRNSYTMNGILRFVDDDNVRGISNDYGYLFIGTGSNAYIAIGDNKIKAEINTKEIVSIEADNVKVNNSLVVTEDNIKDFIPSLKSMFGFTPTESNRFILYPHNYGEYPRVDVFQKDTTGGMNKLVYPDIINTYDSSTEKYQLRVYFPNDEQLNVPYRITITY